MNTGELLAEIGRKIAYYYALLADGDNTRETEKRLIAKIDTLLELLNDLNIEYEIIDNNKGIIINKRSYTYTIKNYAIWSFCINEKYVNCVESEE